MALNSISIVFFFFLRFIPLTLATDEGEKLYRIWTHICSLKREVQHSLVTERDQYLITNCHKSQTLTMAGGLGQFGLILLFYRWENWDLLRLGHVSSEARTRPQAPQFPFHMLLLFYSMCSFCFIPCHHTTIPNTHEGMYFPFLARIDLWPKIK